MPRAVPGYYQEYKVVLPGQTKAGVLRIVTGQSGELYYTWTHYGAGGATPAFVQLCL
ncbi:MAG: ribonuclease domain-containing protein [Chloroflexota bacterium]